MVVIITVHDEDAYRRTALAAGAEAFLEKKTLGASLWPTALKIVQKGKGASLRRGSPQGCVIGGLYDLGEVTI